MRTYFNLKYADDALARSSRRRRIAFIKSTLFTRLKLILQRLIGTFIVDERGICGVFDPNLCAASDYGVSNFGKRNRSTTLASNGDDVLSFGYLFTPEEEGDAETNDDPLEEIIVKERIITIKHTEGLLKEEVYRLNRDAKELYGRFKCLDDGCIDRPIGF